MDVTELSRDQLISLKRNYLIKNNDEVSWCDLADADALVTDEAIMEEYTGYSFVPGDFATENVEL